MGTPPNQTEPAEPASGRVAAPTTGLVLSTIAGHHGTPAVVEARRGALAPTVVPGSSGPRPGPAGSAPFPGLRGKTGAMRWTRGALLTAATATAVAVIATGACSGGSSGPPAEAATTTAAPAGPLVQETLRSDIAPAVLASLGGGIDGRFQLDDETVVVFDPGAGELEYSSAVQRERYEFAGQHGFLGLFGVVLETADGGEFWELTVEIFREEAGARELFAAKGSPGGGAVANSELVGSQEEPYAPGRIGTVHVDRYAHRAFAEGQVHDQGEFLELRGSVVDGNVLVSVLAVVDVTSPEAADPFAAVRRTLDAVDGRYRAHHDAATARS